MKELDQKFGGTLREINRKIIADNKHCGAAINSIRSVEQFWDHFIFLQFGRDYIICGEHVFSLQLIYNSVFLTIGSIIQCCENGCFSDANTLARKYRDDLFFCLYVALYSTNQMVNETAEANNLKKMEKNIGNWIDNELKNMNISMVLKTIGKSNRTSDAVKKYKLKNYFDRIGERLNNYVHSNGVAFYNRNLNGMKPEYVEKQIYSISEDIRYITVVFLFLFILCNPLSVMGTDYLDCLENGIPPLEGSQLWVAPFVSDFIYENSDLIDKGCVEYLHDKTSMEFADSSNV